MKDYEQTYANHWEHILDTSPNREDQIKRELHDYIGLMDETSTVYSHVSGGAISKPNTLGSEVIAQHDRVFIRKGCVADDLRIFAAEGSDVDELRRLVTDYANDLDRED